MSDPSAATGVTAGTPAPPAGRPKYKRKLSNYLLDKKLQLRYVLLVTVLSGVIAGALGYLIYQQRRAAAESLEHDIALLIKSGNSKSDYQDEMASRLASEDRVLVYKMVGVGVGLVVILSLYLLVMTHKVAGPLYKVSMYFDRMAAGKLGKVTPLRQGDMLQDFYGSFHEMHDAVRARAQADVATLEAALSRLRDAKNHADYRGEAQGKLDDALDHLAQQLASRKQHLA